MKSFMRFFRNSITVKISLLVFSSACLVLAVVLSWIYYNSRDLIKEEAEATARNLTRALGNAIEQEFQLVAKSVDDLVASLETFPRDDQALLRLVERTLRETPKAQGIGVAFLPFKFNPNLEKYAAHFFWRNGEIAFNQLGEKGYDYFSKDWFRFAVERGKPVWIEPYFDKEVGRAVMSTYSRPLFKKQSDGANEEFVAVVTAEISIKELNELVNSLKVYETGFCVVMSDKGALITSRVPERIGRMTIFDIVELYKQPKGREVAQTILSQEQGFEDIGSAMTGEDSFIFFSRFYPQGWIVATIMPKREMFAKIDYLHSQTVVMAAAGIILLVVLAVLVASSISRPLRKMASETVRVGHGDLDVDLSSIRSTDEVGQLARAFTDMTKGLKDRERIKDTFGRYLTQEVVKRLLDSKEGIELGGEIRQISMMMSDLRGFTALTSSMNPEHVITFLNRYLGTMLEIILDHHGIVDEIIGDGILAFFGAPETLENHPELAVACAINMQIAMNDINIQNEADGLPHLEMGIAVNTGDVIVGNIGSERRTKYGAVGSQVNFTGRVESFTVGGQILISEATYKALSEKLEIRDVIHVEMKGVPGKVKLYDVKGIKGTHEAKAPDKDETLLQLNEVVTLSVFGMDQKILSGTGKTAVMTHASMMSSKVTFSEEVAKWEDIRMLCNPESSLDLEAEIYGKIISVTPLKDGYEALVRFTSVSAKAYKMLRELLVAGNKTQAS